MSPEPPKQAACLNCRKSKIKCNRDPGGDVCKRCEQLSLKCEIPEFHIGRQRGVKNKRTGLEKAIFQIEQAIKKSKETPQSAGALQELSRLVDDARSAKTSSPSRSLETTPSQDMSDHGDGEATLDDAENPLNLLARASDLRLATPPGSGQASIQSGFSPSVGQRGNERDNRSEVHRFFLPMKAHRDVGVENDVETDPIDLGLVTLDEAMSLLANFYENLAHTRWGLDQRIHNLDFLRAQSTFLLTSVLAASALFVKSAGALATRLYNHRTSLGHRIIAKRFKSVEIVLAFMVNAPWMQAGEQAADDDTALNIAIALSMALDLSLDKIMLPSTGFSSDTLRHVAKAHCIDGRKALAIDGFPDVDPSSRWGRLMLRRRERAWLALYTLERGTCLARGRCYTVPTTPLIDHCDKWHLCDLADAGDGGMVSVTVMRRNLDTLLGTIRAKCDRYRVGDIGAEVAEGIESCINTWFDDWSTTWAEELSKSEPNGLPPYVEILVAHTRLSTYCGVMNHPTAPVEVKKLFQNAGLSAALNVMRAAIQGEPRLESMPNNTSIMISFAACVALNLSTPVPNGIVGLAPSVRSLIEEAADVLERIGNVTPHRHGMSVLYGKFLHELVRNAPPVTAIPRQFEPADVTGMPTSNQNAFQDPSITGLWGFPTALPVQLQPAATWNQPLQFSAMSDNQIIETVQRAGDNYDMLLPDISFDNNNTFMWDKWMSGLEFGF